MQWHIHKSSRMPGFLYSGPTLSYAKGMLICEKEKKAATCSAGVNVRA